MLQNINDIKDLLSKLAEQSESVYWLGDPDFKTLIYISPAFEKIWGRPREPLYKDPSLWISYLHEGDRERHPILEMKARVEEQGKAARFSENYRIVRPDGEIRWIIDRGFPICNSDGKCIAITGVAVDLTKEKQSEIELYNAKQAAEAASLAKSEFIANMSHDLRTPITGILGLAQSWQMTAQNDAHKEDAGLLLDTTQELLNFLNEILETVNLSNGHLEEKTEIFSIKTLVEHNIILLKSAAKHKGLDFRYHIDPDVPAYVRGNRVYLDRSLLNVLSNAIKFTHTGSVTLSVSPSKLEADIAHLTFSVTDTGIGIPENKLEEIFSHFTRLTSSYQGIYKGTGLGLYTVKQYLAAMKGDIRVISAEGKGSTFTIEVPLIVSKQPAGLAEPIAPTPSPIKKSSKTNYSGDAVDNPLATVLVVEDNALAARMAQQVITQAGCTSDWVGSGEEAIEKIKTSKYDLILMDIGLPGIDGLETTRQIRELAEGKLIPIIALTGHLSEEKRTECLSAGMQDLTTKPTSLPALQQLLSQYVLREDNKPSQKIEIPATAKPLKSIDWEEGTRLAGGNRKSAEHLLNLLIKTLPDELEQINDAYERKQLKKMADLLHRFYGGLCYCGLPRLRLLTKQLRIAINDKASDEKIASLFFDFEKEMEELMNAVEI